MPYFSHDTDARRDRKAKLFISHTGFAGWGFFFAVLEDIYKNNYYLPWTEEDQHLFVAEFNCPQFPITYEDVDFLIKQACSWGLLSAKMYNQHNIFTSASVQRRWLKQSARRVLAEIYEDYLLINIKDFYQKELSDSRLSVRIVDENGVCKEIYGDYVENSPQNGVNGDSNGETVDNNVDNSVEYDSKYDFEAAEMWDGNQPIDYAGCVDVWNSITGARSRTTDSKRGDLRRVFRNYSGVECYHAMIIRAQDETLRDSKYLTDWSTLFGAKKLENLDKWVERAREWLDRQQKIQSVDEHLETGWFTQSAYWQLCEKAGVDPEDGMFCDTKHVEEKLLYYPKFSY